MIFNTFKVLLEENKEYQITISDSNGTQLYQSELTNTQSHVIESEIPESIQVKIDTFDELISLNEVQPEKVYNFNLDTKELKEGCFGEDVKNGIELELKKKEETKKNDDDQKETNDQQQEVDQQQKEQQEQLEQQKKKQEEQEIKEQRKEWVFSVDNDDNNKQQQTNYQSSVIINSSNKQDQNSISAVNSSKYEKVLNKLRQRGGGFSEFQSSSSLMHSIPEVSFSKADRFSYNKVHSQTDFNYNIPTTFQGKKATSFGYGNKQISHEYVMKNAKQNPGPDSYFKDDSQMNGGYRKTNWSQQSRFKDNINDVPAPNNYDLQHKFAESKVKFTMGLKHKPLPSFSSQVPSPNEYNQSIKAIAQNRYNGVSLGSGNKINFASSNQTPGPGQYNIGSVFSNNAKSIMYVKKN